MKQLKSCGKMPFWQLGDDLGGDEETVISCTFSKPVLIHRYPAHIKPFYMKNDPARPTFVFEHGHDRSGGIRVRSSVAASAKMIMTHSSRN
jgi:hypothetical protein